MKFYLEVTIGGELFSESELYDSHVEAQRKAEEVQPILDKLTDMLDKSYTMLIKHAQVECPVCRQKLDSLDGIVAEYGDDQTEWVDVCEKCEEDYCREVDIAKRDAVARVTRRFLDSAVATKTRKNEG